jgi:hypothetical protein
MNQIYMSSNNSDTVNGLVQTAAIVGSAYAATNLADVEARRQVEISKVQLEEQKMLSSSERLFRAQVSEHDRKVTRFETQVRFLSNSLVDWSHNRCSPITPHQWADEAEVRLMELGGQLAPMATARLEKVFDSQRKTCGTSYQFKEIYRWIDLVNRDHPDRALARPMTPATFP